MDNVCTDLNDGTQHGFHDINASSGMNSHNDLGGCEISETEQFTAPVVETTSKKRNKGQAVRSKNFTSVEDEMICCAYLNVSKDPIVGTNQSMGTYWQRIRDYYNENKKTTTTQIERKNQSGKSEDDKVKDALQLYEGLLGPFKFLHCWLILRKEQKWNEFLAEKWAPNSKAVEGVAAPADGNAAAAPVDKDVIENFVRPMGRDRAKRLRSNSSAASSSPCLEVLQKIQCDRAQFEEKLEAQSKEESIEMAARYERKLSIQQEALDVQKRLLEKQVMLQERALELQEKERADRIMGIDLDKMSPWARSYYLAEQKDIAEKKGLVNSSTDP